MRLTSRKVGWIGVDVGTSTVKIAQVARSKQGWNVIASAIVPRHQTWQPGQLRAKEALSSLDELQAAQSIQQDYRGRKVAATLPMSLCDIHRLDRDLSKESNAEKVLRQTIETATQKSSAHLQCDFWSSPAVNDQPAWTQALAVPQSWTDQLSEDIARAGWSCRAIDGSPLAVARAVAMTHPADDQLPVAALDWGNGRATLSFLEKGQPTYVRCLKESGLRTLLEALTENLEVNELEAQHLLETYGASAAYSNEPDEIANLVDEIITEGLRHIVEEIKRSIAHFQYVRRSPRPALLYLVGGGAMIQRLDHHLSNCLDVEVKNWKLSPEEPDTCSIGAHTECILATAIALSALAWEDS